MSDMFLLWTTFLFSTEKLVMYFVYDSFYVFLVEFLETRVKCIDYCIILKNCEQYQSQEECSVLAIKLKDKTSLAHCSSHSLSKLIACKQRYEFYLESLKKDRSFKNFNIIAKKCGFKVELGKLHDVILKVSNDNKFFNEDGLSRIFRNLVNHPFKDSLTINKKYLSMNSYTFYDCDAYERLSAQEKKFNQIALLLKINKEHLRYILK